MRTGIAGPATRGVSSRPFRQSAVSVSLNNVTYRFGRLMAVRGVTVGIPSGEVVGLVGPIGAGKSTLLRLIAGLIPPEDGQVVTLGMNSRVDAGAIRRRVGYVSQAVPHWPEARVDEFLTFRATLKDIAGLRRPAEVDRVLQLAGLTTQRKRLIGRLSHGYQRRVCLADALLAEPPLLLLDEPTAGLDLGSAGETCALLKSLPGQRTVVLSTHVLPEAEALCSRVLVIVRGELVEDVALRSRAPVRTEAEALVHAESLRQWLESTGLAGDIAPLGGGWQRLRIDGLTPEELGRVFQGKGWPLRLLRSADSNLSARLTRWLSRAA